MSLARATLNPLRARIISVAAVILGAVPLAAQDVACGPAPGNPPYEAWQIIGLPQSSLVFARDSSLIGEIGLDWRTTISIKTLPK